MYRELNQTALLMAPQTHTSVVEETQWCLVDSRAYPSGLQLAETENMTSTFTRDSTSGMSPMV